MTKSIAIAIVSSLAILVAADGNAFAQAGSTGGTIGKTDKSASGGSDFTAISPRKRVAPTDTSHTRNISGCRNIVGTWKWYLGLTETTFLADGSARHSSGVTGKWQCVGSAISAIWSNGVKEHYVLSPDGNSLFVDTSWNGGTSFVVTRESH